MALWTRFVSGRDQRIGSPWSCVGGKDSLYGSRGLTGGPIVCGRLCCSRLRSSCRFEWTRHFESGGEVVRDLVIGYVVCLGLSIFGEWSRVSIDEGCGCRKRRHRVLRFPCVLATAKHGAARGLGCRLPSPRVKQNTAQGDNPLSTQCAAGEKGNDLPC